MPSDKPTLQKYNGLVHKGIDRAIKWRNTYSTGSTNAMKRDWKESVLVV
jgi:hypothetical protein